MNLLIYSITCYGITNIMVFSHMFKKWRNFWDRVNPNFFGKLFNCPMCLGLWVGIILTLILILFGGTSLSPFISGGIKNNYISIFLDGCFSSGIVWLLHTLQEKWEFRENQ